MADLANLRTALRDHTGKGSTILTDTICDLCVNAAEERMDQAHRWRGQETSADITYGMTDDGKALPSGFISELLFTWEDPNQTDPSAKLKPLRKVEGGRVIWLLSQVTESVRDSYYPQTAAISAGIDADVYYYIWAEKIFVVPNPSESGTYVLDYYGAVPRLVDPTLMENFYTKNYCSCLRWGALVEAWAFLHETVRQAAADAYFEKLLARAIKHDQQTAMSGPPRTRGT